MISLIIPFKDDYERISDTLRLLSEEINKYPIEEVIFSYNGLNLLNKKIKIQIEASNPMFKVCETSKIGIGAGYKMGIQFAKGNWLLLSASDLPFKFSDLDNFLQSIKFNGEALYLGSKLHKDSKIERQSLLRSFLTIGFYILRKFLFGREVPKDCQGTIFLSSKLAKELAHKIPDDDFIFSFKLSQIALLKKVKVIEVPVTLLQSSQNLSSVRPIRTSAIIFFKTIYFRFQTWLCFKYF